jgi:hypothetical protein
LHPKKGEPKNAPVTRAQANTSTNTASTRTGAASTSGGDEHKVDRKTQSASPSYTTADTASTGAEAASSSGGLECKTASFGTEAASISGGLERKSQSKASVENTYSLCKVGICPIPNEKHNTDELLTECFGMNPNVSAINYGSADDDDDAFYIENALFGDDRIKPRDPLRQFVKSFLWQKTSTAHTIVARILQNLLKVARENTHACGCTIS